MTFNDLPYFMFICLILTIIIELTIAIVLLQIRDKKDILNMILVNIITNPIVVSVTNYCLYYYHMKGYNISIIILEILAIIVEGYLYNKYLKYNKLNGYLVSFILNFLSYIIGLFII